MLEPEISIDSYLSPAPGVVGRRVQNEAVVVLASQAKVKVLNEVGARIWSLADGSRNLGEIAAILCTEYQVEPEQAQADVLQFVAELVDRGALLLSKTPLSTASQPQD